MSLFNKGNYTEYGKQDGADPFYGIESMQVNEFVQFVKDHIDKISPNDASEIVSLASMNDNICKSELCEAIISHIAAMEAANAPGYL